MLQDATDQQIKEIRAQFDLRGKTVLEIGCGKGRVTRDLAKFATWVIATDPDAAAIEIARTKISAPNVEFLHTADGIPDLLPKSLDLAIYSLSLHHVPTDEMQSNLLQTGTLLKNDGAILILEPANGGTFNEAKRRFSVGSGDEEPLKAAALAALQSLPGWTVSETTHFMTEFLFADENDFIAHKLPQFRQLQVTQQNEIRRFLQLHRTEHGIILTAERRLNLLRPVLKAES